MTEQNYTSLELSQKLQEAGFEGESEMWWVRKRDNSEGIAKKIEDIKYKFILERWGEVSDSCNFPAYDILNDLCVRYVKEMWKNPWKVLPVLDLLQQGEKAEAEQYILDNSILFKNK